mgnify:CR=1 FL=1
MKSCTERCSPASESSNSSNGQNIDALKETMSTLLERQKLVERSIFNEDKHTKLSITHRKTIHTLILSLFGVGSMGLSNISEVNLPGVTLTTRFQIVDYLVAMRTRFQELHLHLNLNASDIILAEHKVATLHWMNSINICRRQLSAISIVIPFTCLSFYKLTKSDLLTKSQCIE